MIKAIEIYELYKSTWNGDEYEPSRESRIAGPFTKMYKAEREKRRLEGEEEIKRNNPKEKWKDYVRFYIKPKLVRAEDIDYKVRPNKLFRHIEEIKPLEDACGSIKELYSSENMSLAYVSLSGKGKKHKHNIMEEVYFVTKGEGYLTIESNTYNIEEGDTISIPKGSWHSLATDKSLELIVATYPGFDRDDVILD